MLEDELAQGAGEKKELPPRPESPGGTGSAEVELRSQLQEAKETTKVMTQKARDIQDQFNAMMRDKTQVQSQLNQELDVLKAVKDVGSTPSEAALGQLRDE